MASRRYKSFLFTFGLSISAPTARAVYSPCEPYFEDELGDAAQTRQRLRNSQLAQFEPPSVEMIDDHGGYVIAPERFTLDRVFSLPDLNYNGKVWRIEQWPTETVPLYFYDAGLINLRDDANLVNSLVLSEMRSEPKPRLTLVHEMYRCQDLIRLHRFRDVLAGADVRADNSFVDTLGLLREPLRWSAATPEIDAAVELSAQIHYGRKVDYVTPRVHELLTHLEFSAPVPDPLPVLKNVAATSTLARDFERQFPDERACEVTFPRGAWGALPAAARHRMMYQILRRVRRNECTVVTVALSEALTKRLTTDYAFTRWRTVPGHEGARSWLSYLRVRSSEYIETMGRLHDLMSVGPIR